MVVVLLALWYKQHSNESSVGAMAITAMLARIAGVVSSVNKNSYHSNVSHISDVMVMVVGSSGSLVGWAAGGNKNGAVVVAARNPGSGILAAVIVMAFLVGAGDCCIMMHDGCSHSCLKSVNCQRQKKLNSGVRVG